MERASASDLAIATVARGAGNIETSNIFGAFTAECYDVSGELKWREDFPNGVTDQGKGHLLNLGLVGGGGSTTVSSRMAFLTTSTYSASSTYSAPSPIIEASSGVIANRGTITWGAVSGSGTVSKGTSTQTTVSIIGSATITGIAIVVTASSVTTLGNVSDTSQAGAVLYSVGAFGSSKTVSNGDTLSVTYTTSLA